jgi:hypothetical protein
MPRSYQKRQSAVKKGQEGCRRHQKRLSAVKKGRIGCLGCLIRAADIKKGRRLSEKAVGHQKRPWGLPWTSSTCRWHQKRPSFVQKAVGRQKRLWRLPLTSSTCCRQKKRPWVVKKGREGCHGSLVRAADIKKGLRYSKKAVKAATFCTCRGHQKRPRRPIRPPGTCREPDDFFSRMRGTCRKKIVGFPASLHWQDKCSNFISDQIKF